MWHKLEQFRISGDFLKTLQALYADVKCSVHVNNTLTDWFNVSMRLKQGCILSPQLFHAFLNDLTQCINELHCGVECEENSTSMLLYADDIILIASDEHKLQRMLDALDEYCKTWRLTINPNKSKLFISAERVALDPHNNFTVAIKLLKLLAVINIWV